MLYPWSVNTSNKLFTMIHISLVNRIFICAAKVAQGRNPSVDLDTGRDGQETKLSVSLQRGIVMEGGDIGLQ